MSQLRRGFFDASELEGLDDDGEQAAGGGGNHSPIDPGTMGDAELRRGTSGSPPSVTGCAAMETRRAESTLPTCSAC